MNRLKVAILCGGVTIIGLASCSKHADEVDASRREPLLASLKDPESARFRNERITKSGAICGEVNSKNSMGGYVGFKRYVLAGPGANYIEDGGAIGQWSDADAQAIKDGSSELLGKILAYNAKNRALPMDVPSAPAREAMIEAELFEKKWKALCGTGKT